VRLVYTPTNQSLAGRTQWMLFYDVQLGPKSAKRKWVAGTDFRKLVNSRGRLVPHLIAVRP
jgi:hypothetical protein